MFMFVNIDESPFRAASYSYFTFEYYSSSATSLLIDPMQWRRIKSLPSGSASALHWWIDVFCINFDGVVHQNTDPYSLLTF